MFGSHIPHFGFGLGDQRGGRDAQYLSNLQQNHDIGTLDAAFHKTNEGSVYSRRLSKVLLRYVLFVAGFSQSLAKCPLRTYGGLELRSILNLLAGYQVNMLPC